MVRIWGLGKSARARIERADLGGRLVDRQWLVNGRRGVTRGGASCTVRPTAEPWDEECLGNAKTK